MNANDYRDVKRAHWASVRANDAFLNISSYSGFRGGMIFDSNSYSAFLETNVKETDLGASVREALSKSRFVLPKANERDLYPSELEFDEDLCDFRKSTERYNFWVNETMNRFGYKSQKSFYNGMRYCSIELRDHILTIQPSNHLKNDAWDREGITKEDNVIVPDAGTDVEIGSALRLALSRCLDSAQ